MTSATNNNTVVSKVQRVKRGHSYTSSPVKPTPIKVPKNHSTFLEGGMHSAVADIYRHIFSGGSLDQMRHEDVIILILNPTFKDGPVKRKSYGTLYDRTVVYINIVTGYIETRQPRSWGNISLDELTEAIADAEKERLV